jgi:nickel transport system substrate-binding protein
MEKKKKIALLICIITGGILIASCIAPQEEASKKLPQEIVIGMGEDIKGLESVYGCPWGAPLRTIYETLVTEDSSLKIQPLLAESWEISEDGKVWTFHLNKGIKFHDDTPFNASAVKFSFEYNPAPYRALPRSITTIMS